MDGPAGVAAPLVGLGRRVKPQAQFLWNRITPGRAGAGTDGDGGGALGRRCSCSSDTPGSSRPTRGRPRGTRRCRMSAIDLAAGWLTDIAKVVTALGSARFMAVWRWPQRCWPAADVRRGGVLVVAMSILDLGAGVEGGRRPPAPGGRAGGRASGLVSERARRLLDALRVAGPGGGVPVAAAAGRGHRGGDRGVVVAAAVGLSRVYLQVHCLWDVPADGPWTVRVHLLLDRRASPLTARRPIRRRP